MMNSAPEVIACSWVMAARSAPMIPSGKPGKFSTFSTLMMDAPPIMRSMIPVRSPCRAAYIPAVIPARPPPTIRTS